jgi:hypothetical protein
VAAVDADEGALIEDRSALLIAGASDRPVSLRALIEGASTESAERDGEQHDQELTFLNKSVKSAHAISPDAIILWSVFNRRRALTCM